MQPKSGKDDDVMSYFRVIKWRRIKPTEHVPQMEVVQNVYKILDGKIWREQTTCKTHA